MFSFSTRRPNMSVITTSLLLACSSSYLTALAFGFAIGYSSPVLPRMTAEGVLDDNTASWFGSILTIGGIIGCLFGGILVDQVGRKWSLFLNCVPYSVGLLLVWFCQDVMLLCLGRTISGVACGMSTVVCPLYVSEMTPKEVRGMLGSGVQLSITVGIVLAYLGGIVCTWRNLALLGASFSLVAAVMIAKCPETPRFSISRGRSQEAAAILKQIRSPTANTTEELRDMEASLSGGESGGVSVWELFSRPQLSRPLGVAVTLMVLQQLTGINVVMFYTVSIFEGAGFGEQGELATLGVGLTQVVMTVVACVFMDRAGRRLLLVVAGLGMALSFLLLSYYYHTMSSRLHFLPVVALVAYIVFFSLGWGPIPMLVTSEIFPLKARGAASGVASLTNWSVAFIVTKQFSLIKSLLGLDGAFTLFGLCCLGSVAVVLKMVPETRGRSLEEMEAHFSQPGGRLK